MRSSTPGLTYWCLTALRACAGMTAVAGPVLVASALFPSPVQAAEPALAAEARAAMERATGYMRSIATEGGYLWRYSTDLKERAGENKATATQIWVQPPGTPSMGMTFLRAYEVTGDARYLDAAKAAADALATGQLESGGWDYLVEFDPKLSPGWYRRSEKGKLSAAEAAKRKNVSTFDDDTTQSALRLLLAVADASKDSTDPRDVRIREARDYGLAKLIAGQLPNGGWPQRWSGVPADPKTHPVKAASFPAEWSRTHQKENYYGHYTLNDNTHRDCVLTLLDAARRLGQPEYRAAALRGGDFLIAAQLPEPQPAWAQQYNPQMQPAWARAFEPPGICSNESGGAMHLLVDLYLETGDAKYLAPLPRAIAWFKRSEVAPNRWARLYELETNKPIYGDRDGKYYYRIEDLSPERQTGYSWSGAYGVPEAIALYDTVTKVGRDTVLERRKPSRGPASKGTFEQATQRAQAAIAALDAQGRWIATEKGAPAITMANFSVQMRTLCMYLEVVKRGEAPAK
jgi:PelA/Pel-15E family pectate lyase